MPRVSLRRSCLGLAIIFGLSLFTLIAHYGDQPFTTSSSTGQSDKPPSSVSKGPPPLEVILTNEDETPYLEGIAADETPGRFWFMRDGWVRPDNPSSTHRGTRRPMWPHEADTDRIVEQLMFVPPNMDEMTNNGTKLKKILIFNGINNWSPLRSGQDTFLKDNCPVSSCSITANREEAATADAILFRDHFSPPGHRRSPSQVWILYMLECPLHTQSFGYRNVFNWTATYRHDSDIVAPYEKFVPYDVNVKYLPPRRNYALNKTGKVAWFVSNCGSRNGRLNFARQLSQYIEVDIFGACGTKTCPRSQMDKCSKMLDTKYKFYLSFENSNCRDYITEKFFVNGLSQDVIPIVMGARKDDYLRAAPPHSFISVDEYDSPKELAEYLHKLDKNETLYNEYFRWKGTGEFINTYFWCRVCAMLHDVQSPKVYNNIDLWWRGPGTCVDRSWRKTERASAWWR